MPRRHVAALDGLRAFAVVSVIVYHTLDGRIAQSLWVGVDLFFVLSGYLITGILLDAKRSPNYFRNFYIRRTLRIFPLYYATLLAALVIAPHVLSRTPEISAVLAKQGWLWAYAQNIEEFVHGHQQWRAGWLQLTHLWSLSVEEQFYLVWPAVVLLASRRALFWLAIGIVVAAPLFRAALLVRGVLPEVVYTFTPCRLDTLAIGALLAIVVRESPERVPLLARGLVIAGSLATVLVIAICGGLPARDAIVQIAGLSALAVLFGGIVISAEHQRWLAHPVLVTIGKYSYAIYVLSYLLDPLFTKLYGKLFGDTTSIGLTLFELAASVGVAAVSWRFLERPCVALKDRWTR